MAALDWSREFGSFNSSMDSSLSTALSWVDNSSSHEDGTSRGPSYQFVDHIALSKTFSCHLRKYKLLVRKS